MQLIVGWVVIVSTNLNQSASKNRVRVSAYPPNEMLKHQKAIGYSHHDWDVCSRCAPHFGMSTLLLREGLWPDYYSTAWLSISFRKADTRQSFIATLLTIWSSFLVQDGTCVTAKGSLRSRERNSVVRFARINCFVWRGEIACNTQSPVMNVTDYTFSPPILPLLLPSLAPD